MAKKAKSPVVMGIGSRSYVCPSHWGLTGKPWSAVENISMEAARLMERYRKLGAERQSLVEELDFQRRRHYEDEVQAARQDEDLPEPKYIELTQKSIARVDKKIAALKAAADRVDAEYHAAVQALREDSDERVADCIATGKQCHERYLEHVSAAEEARSQMGVYLGLARFLSYQQDELGPPPNDSVGQPWWQQRIGWPDEEPDPTISSTSAGSIL